MNHIDIFIQLDSEQWKEWYTEQEWESFFQEITSTILKYFKIDHSIELSVVLSDDKFVQNLNKQYRHKDKPTNVLSFSQITLDQIYQLSDQKDILLGDIVMSYGVIQKEMREQNKRFIDHVTHLFIHSILHLLGFDHIDEEDAKDMEKLEIEFLEKLNIKNPYQ